MESEALELGGGTYVQPSAHAVGQRRTLESIDRTLAQFEITDVLQAIGQIAFETSTQEVKRHVRLAESLDPKIGSQYRQLVEANQYGELLLVDDRSLQLLAVRALAVCASRDPAGDPLRLRRHVLRLVLSLQDHAGSEPLNEESFWLELARLAVFYLDPPYDQSTEITSRVLAAHTAFDATHVDWVDLDGLVRRKSGLNLANVLSLSLLACQFSGSDERSSEWPPPISPDMGLPTEWLNRWACLWSQTLLQAQTRSTSDLDRGHWAIGTLVGCPLIQIGSKRWTRVRPANIERLVSMSAFRDLFERLVAEEGGDRKRVSTYLGRLFETACGNLLNEELRSDVDVLNESQLKQLGPADGKTCDAMILESETATAIDFTVSGLTASSLTDSEPSVLWADYSNAIGHKLDQLDETLAALLKTKRPSLVAPVIVVAGALPWHKGVRDFLARLVLSKDREVLGTEASLPAMLLTAVDLRWLFSGARYFDAEVAEVLRRWSDSPLAGKPLRTFLETQEVPPPGVPISKDISRQWYANATAEVRAQIQQAN